MARFTAGDSLVKTERLCCGFLLPVNQDKQIYLIQSKLLHVPGDLEGLLALSPNVSVYLLNDLISQMQFGGFIVGVW